MKAVILGVVCLLIVGCGGGGSPKSSQFHAKSVIICPNGKPCIEVEGAVKPGAKVSVSQAETAVQLGIKLLEKK